MSNSRKTDHEIDELLSNVYNYKDLLKVLNKLADDSESQTSLVDYIFIGNGKDILYRLIDPKTTSTNSLIGFCNAFPGRRKVILDHFLMHKNLYYLISSMSYLEFEKFCQHFPQHISRLISRANEHFPYPVWEYFPFLPNFLLKNRKYLEDIYSALLQAANDCNKSALNDILLKIKNDGIFPVNFVINSARNPGNATPLILAASGESRKIPTRHSLETVTLLLDNGADPFAITLDERTALMEAANFGRLQVINLLIDSIPLDKRAGYISQADDVGYSASFYANYHHHENVVLALTQRLEQTKAALLQTPSKEIDFKLNYKDVCDEEKQDLSNKCSSIPSSVKHDVSRYSFFVYGGLNTRPKIRYRMVYPDGHQKFGITSNLGDRLSLARVAGATLHVDVGRNCWQRACK